MKKTIVKIMLVSLYFLIPLLLVSVAYLLAAFILMDINALNWSIESRALVEFSFIMMIIIGVCAAVIVNTDYYSE